MQPKNNGKPITQVRLMLVRPDMAAKWIKLNTANRNLYPRVVDWYAQDMKDGRWFTSPDAISFDKHPNGPDAKLLNGQHRLHAIIQAGVPVWMYVGWNFTDFDQFMMDQGRGRTLRDAVKVTTGENLTFYALACASKMMGERHRELSMQRRRDWFEKHRKAIEFAVRSSHGMGRSEVNATIARAFYDKSIDKDRLAAFGDICTTGIAQDGNDDVAAVRLWKWLMLCRAENRSPSTDEVYFKAQRALRAFLDREPLSSLYPAPQELFLLPGESEGRLAGKGRIGTKNPGAKLNNSQVIRIRKSYASGKKSIQVLSEEYDLGEQAIRDVVKGKSYVNVGGPTVDTLLSRRALNKTKKK